MLEHIIISQTVKKNCQNYRQIIEIKIEEQLRDII